MKLVILMVFSGALLRLAPHFPNFTPVTATALFAGAYLNKKYSLLVALAAMALSDYLLLYINPYNSPMVDFSQFHLISEMFHSTTSYVWGSFLISGFLGMYLKDKVKPFRVVSMSLIASLQFFMVTNFGVWAAGYYAPGIEGLVESYIMGIPFYKWTLLGDLFYTSAFFLSYELALKMRGKILAKF